MQLPMSRGDYSWELLVRVCGPVLQILTLFQTKKNVIFHTRLQTRSLKSIPVFRLGLKAVIMWLSLLRLERKQNSSSNPFRFRIFLCLSYSIGMETINFSYVYVHISLKTHTRFQTKMGTVYTRFQTKTAQKPYPIDGAAHTYIA